MKKKYINPTVTAYALTQRTSLLDTSGSIKKENALDSASPTDPEDGETMSVKGEVWGGGW